MPEGLQRRYGRSQLHFITCSCYERLPLLGTANSRDLFVKILGEVRDRYGFALTGYVVMPEHIHLLVGEPAKGTPSTVMQVLKQRVSRNSKLADPSNQESSHFWEQRFYDFNVWSQEKITEKLHYMHLNPMKRGPVSHPNEWPWSSFSFYSDGEGGLLRIDPAR
jgi:putative transposase